jgi:5-formyltetrahydrofolate cyclo-ligase
LDPVELEACKRELRRAARAAAPGDRSDQARRCLERLLARPELRGPGAIALYASIGDEVPVESAFPALRERGWRVLFPRVEGAELALSEAEPAGLAVARLAPGLREPPAGRPAVPVGQVDAFVVPGLLFARDGTRLGRGAGYYDRLLRRARPGALRIGICYADRVRDSLPRAPHDVPVDLVVTDQAVFHCPASAGPEGSG